MLLCILKTSLTIKLLIFSSEEYLNTTMHISSKLINMNDFGEVHEMHEILLPS